MVYCRRWRSEGDRHADPVGVLQSEVLGNDSHRGWPVTPKRVCDARKAVGGVLAPFALAKGDVPSQQRPVGGCSMKRVGRVRRIGVKHVVEYSVMDDLAPVGNQFPFANGVHHDGDIIDRGA